jgi:ribose 5-phosphate isomerase A
LALQYKEKIVDSKERAGLWAAAQVEDGMTVGLGTGSTAAWFIRGVARRMRQENLRITLASSSFSTSLLAAELGLSLIPLEQVTRLDLYADGADEFDPSKRLIKGRGAAMVREKHLVHLSDRFLVLVDPSKRVERLGTNFPVPVEVFPFATGLVGDELAKLGGQVTIRPAGTSKDGPVVTDQGNFVLDARFDAAGDVAGLDAAINNIPGVVGHGLFTRYADRITVAVGHADRVEIIA